MKRKPHLAVLAGKVPDDSSTRAKVQAPRELKPCFNLGPQEEESGGEGSLQCSVKACSTEDHDESVRVTPSARPRLPSNPPEERKTLLRR